MQFRIADTFTDSLARLTGDEQKAVKTTAFDLQMNPASPGMSFHKLDKARDKNFWSVRVNADIRLIVHRTGASLLLCYVDHHDKAYHWAERRRLETHPQTGAAQLVEVRETVQEIVVPVYVEAQVVQAAALRAAPLFASLPDEQLLGYGIPTEWLSDVRQATETSLLELVEHLPAEAAEALLELATGGTPRKPEPIAVTEPVPTPEPEVTPEAFEHPDAQRRFRVVGSLEELQRALEFPWDKWTIFLHPEQRQWVEKDQGGPARVAGAAGTGKTIVALHRAAYLARTNPDARVLLTTFSTILANDLQARLKRLVYHEPKLAERIDVYAINAIGARLFRMHCGGATPASLDDVAGLLKEASAEVGGHKFTPTFLRAEWEQVVDAWQLETWEAYRDVARLGRKTRLPEAQRAQLWQVFSLVRARLEAANQLTRAAMFTRLAEALRQLPRVPFDFVVVDEAQDLTVAHLRFLAALGRERPDSLFFAGDLGQRIFQPPFSWKSLGVDVRGRSRTLRVNYRTSHQIRQHADRLLGPEVSDIDGNVETRDDTISVFNGPPPEIRCYDSEEEESIAVGTWLEQQHEAGVAPHEMAVFVRSDAQLNRAQAALDAAGLSYAVLDERSETATSKVTLCTMHLAKGLEFRAVAVMACDDEVIPLQQRIEAIGDDADLREVYDTERHLLYVACTRARDHLLITSVNPASEFVDDLRVKCRGNSCTHFFLDGRRRF